MVWCLITHRDNLAGQACHGPQVVCLYDACSGRGERCKLRPSEVCSKSADLSRDSPTDNHACVLRDVRLSHSGVKQLISKYCQDRS
jgi:hypothetical protein